MLSSMLLHGQLSQYKLSLGSYRMLATQTPAVPSAISSGTTEHISSGTTEHSFQTSATQ
jgi:hypothetical protein